MRAFSQIFLFSSWRSSLWTTTTYAQNTLFPDVKSSNMSNAHVSGYHLRI